MIQLRNYIVFIFLIFATSSFSQTTYPKIAAYIGIVHPLVTFSKDEITTNFDGYYLVGMPAGINFWKSATVGFSFEVVPYIRAENGSSRMNNILFHPGILLTLGHGYTFAGRTAFETSGRYGVTPIFIKTVKKNKNNSYFIATPLPLRFGNERPVTFGIGFQFGMAF